MYQYINQYDKGKQQIAVLLDGQYVFHISENKGFSGGWLVQAADSEKTKHFETLEAAKNFCETTYFFKHNTRGIEK